MSGIDPSRAIDRFVVGLPTDPDELAQAIAERAIDRTTVVESLLRSLADPEGAVRLRAAFRVARMDEISPLVAARVRVIAGTDQDPRARSAAVAALRAHALPAPDDHEAPPARGPRRRPTLWLRAVVVRSTGRGAVSLVARDRLSDPEVRGRCSEDERGLLRLELTGLPEAFCGTLPTVRVRIGDAAETTAITAAAEAVTAEGSVTIHFAPDLGSVEEVIGWLGTEIELVAGDG